MPTSTPAFNFFFLVYLVIMYSYTSMPTEMLIIVCFFCHGIFLVDFGFFWDEAFLKSPEHSFFQKKCQKKLKVSVVVLPPKNQILLRVVF